MAAVFASLFSIVGHGIGPECQQVNRYVFSHGKGIAAVRGRCEAHDIKRLPCVVAPIPSRGFVGQQDHEFKVQPVPASRNIGAASSAFVGSFKCVKAVDWCRDCDWLTNERRPRKNCISEKRKKFFLSIRDLDAGVSCSLLNIKLNNRVMGLDHLLYSDFYGWRPPVINDRYIIGEADIVFVPPNPISKSNCEIQPGTNPGYISVLSYFALSSGSVSRIPGSNRSAFRVMHASADQPELPNKERGLAATNNNKSPSENRYRLPARHAPKGFVVFLLVSGLLSFLVTTCFVGIVYGEEGHGEDEPQQAKTSNGSPHPRPNGDYKSSS